MDADDRIRRARSLRSVADAAAVYDHWAPDYDADVFGRLGFTGSERIADLLVAHMDDTGAAVLDLGCGTGAVGARLAKGAIGRIDGVDLSPAMLALARTTRAYGMLVAADLTRPLPFRDGAYAASVSAGTFTSGHVGPGAVAACTRVVRPGGLVAWVIGTAVIDEFEPALARAGLRIRHRSVEVIRRDGPPEGVMIVATRVGA